MTLFDFFLLTLSAGAIIDCWFNGSIFGECRAYLQFRVDDANTIDQEPQASETYSGDTDEIDEDAEPSFVMRIADRVIPALLAELLTCAFCLSYHVSWVVLLLFFTPLLAGIESPAITFLCKLPVYSLAITRAGNLLNTFLPAHARYEQ